jgi:hypothetical protein
MPQQLAFVMFCALHQLMPMCCPAGSSSFHRPSCGPIHCCDTLCHCCPGVWRDCATSHMFTIWSKGSPFSGAFKFARATCCGKGPDLTNSVLCDPDMMCLQVGAYSAWFVRALMLVCSPIAYPIARLLDFVLGAEHSVSVAGQLIGRGQLSMSSHQGYPSSSTITFISVPLIYAGPVSESPAESLG